MFVIKNMSLEPYFNLASEEYMLEHSDSDIFMLWRNSPAVIIGKNQNTWSEVNVAYTEENGIKVVRRLTGGGAVFHDLGNINFTFITDAEEGVVLDFSRFAAPIVAALNKMGVSAALDGRNDILAEGYKISGNAQCVYIRSDGKKRLMHHGTLLFGADLSHLAAALTVNEEKIKSKGISSVKSRVKNISSFESYTGPRDEVGFLNNIAGEEGCDFTSDEKCGIQKLADEKYSSWEWNFGKSPSGEIQREKRYPFGCINVIIDTMNGSISRLKIYGDFFGTRDITELEKKLTGCPLKTESIMNSLEEAGDLVGKCIDGCSAQILCDLITGKENKKY